MKHTLLLVVLLMIGLDLLAQQQQSIQNFNLSQGLRFEENKGQVADSEGNVRKDILFTLKDKGINLYFTKTGIHYQWYYTEELMDGPYRISEATGLPIKEEGDQLPKKFKEPKPTRLHTYRVDMQWLNTNKSVEVIAAQPFEDNNNYYHAHCPEGITNVKSYALLTYKDMYPGIDVVYYIKEGHLKYDVLVSAGADLTKVKFSYDGATPELINGKLRLETPLGFLEEQEPVAWDERGELINVDYSKVGGKAGFSLSKKNRSDFVIDPDLIWGTYYGGNSDEEGNSTGVDGTGSVYLVGRTQSTNDISSGGHLNSNAGGYDAFLVKFSSTGIRQWATFYGGSGSEWGNSVAIDGAEYVYIAGQSNSTTGIASGGHQNTNQGATDAFLAKFSPSGIRQWCTYYGGIGNDQAYSTAVDGADNVFLAGYAQSQNIASGGHQTIFGGGVSDAFLVKFSSSGVREWATFYGGTASEWGYSIVVDGSNNVILGGTTQSSSNIDFNGHQSSYGGGTFDAFLVKFSSVGARQWGTYYGGIGVDQGSSVAVDGTGNVYLAGYTQSTTGGISSGGHQNSHGGSQDAFLAKFSSSGVRQWGTYYGGTGSEEGLSTVIDGVGNAYLAGLTTSTAGIGSSGYQNTLAGSYDVFLAKFSTDGVREWGTYYGGSEQDEGRSIDVDGSGNVYIAGNTRSSSDIANLGHQNTFGGGTTDAFLVKIYGLITEPTEQPTNLVFSSVTASSMTVSYTAATGSPTGYLVVRKSGSAPTTDPLDGTIYSVSGTLGDGTIAYVGSAVTFNETALTASTTYHYKIYSYNGSGATINYRQTAPLTGSQSILATEPTAQPTALNFTSVTSTSFTVNYTAASGSPAGYIVIRRSGSAATVVPVDGTTYTVGAAVGDGTIAYVGSAVTFNETALTASTTYHYRIYSYNGSGATINYRQTSPLTGSQSTLATEPTAQPTALNFTSVTSTSFTVNYTAASGTPAGYIAVRRIGAAPTTDPVDGTVYTTGNTIGDGTIAYVGSAATFNEVSLAASTTYHYKIYSYNGSGATINYRQTAPLTGSQSTLATEPTAQPTALNFTSVTSTSFTVNYTAASGTPAGYIAVRRIGAAPTTDPVDGTVYTTGNTIGDGTIAYVGSAVTFNETGLAASTTYHYKIYSYNGSGSTINYRQTSPLTGSQATGAGGTAEPTAQPTNLLFSSVTSISMTVSYTAATGSPAGYLVVRKSGSAPTTDPVDGTAYSVSDPLGDGTIAYVGSAVTFNETALTASTTYHYKIYSYNGSGATINYRQTSPLTGSQATGAGGTAEPTAQPTNLLFSSVTSTSMTVSYTAATGSPAGYLVVRKSGSAPTTDPVDGTAYSVSDPLGDGTIAYVGSAVTFNETSLEASTTYHYKIYSYNGSGSTINYRQTSPLTGSQATSAGGTAEPTAQPTNLLFSSVTSTSMTVSYTAATGSPAGYLVVRKSGSAPTTDPVDGTAYSVSGPLGDGTIAYVGSAVTFNETALTASTTYHYKIYSYNGSGSTINYRQTSPLTGSQATSAGGTTEPTAQPTNLIFGSVTATSMTVTYTAATGSPAGYLAVRKSGSAPTTDPVDGTTYTVGGPLDDGTIAYVGSGVTFNESGLTASTTYHYKIYSYNGSGTAINYLQTAPLTGSRATDPPAGDTTPPQTGTNATPTKVTAGSSVNVSLVLTDSESGVTSAKISYGPATSNTFTVTDADMTNNSGTWAFTIPTSAQSELGVRYSIIATNGAGLTTTIGPISVSVEHGGTGVTIPYSAFGSTVNNYRIISVPLNLTNKAVNSVLGDNLGTYGDQSKWRMFRYGSGQTQELNGSSSLESGRGYWLIATESSTLDTGPGQSAGSADSPVTIPVTQGWNQIGNPYGFNLAWSDISAANTGLGLGNLRVYRTGSGFADATVLNAAEGGFVFVNTAGTLTFSAIKNASVNGRQREPSPSFRYNSVDSDDWELRLSLQSGTSENILGGFGMHPEAQSGFDQFDDFTLPRFGRHLEINHNKKLYGSNFTRDVVAPAPHYQWQFEVESSGQDVVSMQWSNTHLETSSNKLALWDVDKGLAINMERTTQYQFQAPRRFVVYYGDETYISSQLSELKLTLSEPYPNPSSGPVQFQVWIPDQSVRSYKVEVLDMFGKVVSKLLDRTLEKGSHEIRWHPSESEGAGLYLLRLSDGNQSVYQKLYLIK